MPCSMIGETSSNLHKESYFNFTFLKLSKAYIEVLMPSIVLYKNSSIFIKIVAFIVLFNLIYIDSNTSFHLEQRTFHQITK